MKFSMTHQIVLAGAILSLGVLGGCATATEQVVKPTATQTSAARENAVSVIAAAKSAYAEVKARGFALTTTKPLIMKAEKAFSIGQYAQAISLANKAKKGAEDSINQYYLTQANTNLMKLAKMKGQMSKAQLGQYNQAEKYYGKFKAKEALTLSSRLLVEMKNTLPATYTVVKGNTLWGIAAMPRIYDNPFEWPLIYKANSAKVHDPDLIFPGQIFAINHQAISLQIKAAIYHAKHRGAWKLGQPTHADLLYFKESARQFLQESR